MWILGRKGLRPRPHVSVFEPVWPTVHTYPLKTVAENACFQTLSIVEICENACLSFSYAWTDENGGFRIR